MNKVRFFKLAVLLICLANLNAYGQQKREIPKQEFFGAYSKAVAKTAELAHRIISKNEVFYGDKINSIENNTIEFIPPDSNHSVFETKALDFNKTFLNERIRIGNIVYKRQNGGDWTKETVKPKEKNSNKNYEKLVENNPEFYLSENVSLNGETANLYELSVERIFTSQTSANQTKESVSYWKEKRWISRDGRLLKMELEVESQGLPKRGNRRVSTYQYDSNIKIEAPKMVEQEKK